MKTGESIVQPKHTDLVILLFSSVLAAPISLSDKRPVKRGLCVKLFIQHRMFRRWQRCIEMAITNTFISIVTLIKLTILTSFFVFDHNIPAFQGYILTIAGRNSTDNSVHVLTLVLYQLCKPNDDRFIELPEIRLYGKIIDVLRRKLCLLSVQMVNLIWSKKVELCQIGSWQFSKEWIDSPAITGSNFLMRELGLL
jgi:hypothetical protein